MTHSLTALGMDLAPSVSLSNGALAGGLEAGYAFPLKHSAAEVTPFIAIQPMQLWQGGVAESTPISSIYPLTPQPRRFIDDTV